MYNAAPAFYGFNDFYGYENWVSQLNISIIFSLTLEEKYY